MFGPIPLPDINNDPFKDVMDYLQTVRNNAMQNELERQKNANLAKYQQGELGISQAELALKQKLAPLEQSLKEAQIKSETALTNQRNAFGGLGSGRGGIDIQNQMALMRQAMMDNPGIDMNKANQISSAWQEGNETLPDGSPTPQMSGIAKQLLTNITRRNAPVAIQNQAANYDVLLSDLEDFDIDAVKQLAGPAGKAKLLYAKANMALNPNDPNIDPVARRVISSANQSIMNMDQMRKAYGTSVVPDYVYNTIGKLANPGADIWNDPKQVELNYNNIVKTIRKNRNAFLQKARHGVLAPISNNENDNGKNSNSDPLGIR